MTTLGKGSKPTYRDISGASRRRVRASRCPAPGTPRGNPVPGSLAATRVAANSEAMLRSPATARADRPPLVGRERVLIAARDPRAGHRLVATRYALYLHDGSAWRRLGWEHVDRVDHRAPDLLFQGRPGTVARLADPGRLLALARERVSATTLARVPLCRAGRVVGSATARRPPTADGEVFWVVRLPRDVELSAQEIDEAIRTARIHLGV